MAATTCTGQDILLAIAENVGELKGAFVTTANNTTNFTCSSITVAASTYLYATCRVLGKGNSVISAQTAAGVITVSTAFSSAPAAGDVFQWAWYTGNKVSDAIVAMNESIRYSWPFWYRETIVDRSSATITLAADTNSYSLPTACDGLLAIGIQPANNDPIEWLEWGDESQPYWRVEGEPGAYTLRFTTRFTREGGIHEVYAGQSLCLHYATREPVLTDLTTSSCRLPLDYFWVAAQLYQIRNLANASRTELSTANVAIPQAQQMAALRLQSLGIGKQPPNRVMNPTIQYVNVPQVEGDDSLNSKQIEAGGGNGRRRK